MKVTFFSLHCTVILLENGKEALLEVQNTSIFAHPHHKLLTTNGQMVRGVDSMSCV